MKRDLKERLEDSQRKYRLVANNLTDVVWLIDVDTMSYYYVSPSVNDLRGYTVEEVMTQKLEDVLTPASYQKAMAVFKSSLRDYNKGLDPRDRLELQVVHKNGSTVWTEVVTRFFRDDDRPLMILGIARDISRRKKLEEEREDLIRKLEDSLAEQKRLAKENKVLRGMLPICAECKKIRDEFGKWHDLETFIQERTEAEFTHTICPTCTRKLYPEFEVMGFPIEDE